MKRIVLCFGLSLLLFLTGCWDRKELDDRAIWLATGMDVGTDGGIEVSGQITIPQVQSQGVGSDQQMTQSFFVISAEGKNVDDALYNLQAKLPREAFFGQRRIIFLGEEFAKRGLKKEMDTYTRNPEATIRNDIFVVKGGTAKEALTISNPMEIYPAAAALKEHIESGGRGDTAFLEFLIAANRYGIRPTIPSIEITRTIEGIDDLSSPEVLRLSGVGVFDQHLKMIGYLNAKENRELLWVLGTLKKAVISLPQEEGINSLILTKVKCKIKPHFDNNNEVRFVVNLEGEGKLQESNSGLDMTQAENIKLMEGKFGEKVEKHVQQTITKVQQEFGMDIFGFGEALHRKHPNRWKSLKNNWDQTFSDVNISVKANIKIKHIGMEGPSVLFKESEARS